MPSNNSPSTKGCDVKDYIDGVLHEYGAFFIIIVSVVFVKWLWSEAKCNWSKWLRQIAVAFLIGGLMSNYLADIPEETMGPGTKGVILGLVVLQADALFLGLMALGHKFRNDPAAFITDIIEAWRGGGGKK